MGRTVVVEEQIKSNLSELAASKQVEIGLLLGQRSSQRDFVAFSIRTPSLDELDKTKGGAEEDLFVSWWVVEHASQVLKSAQVRLRKILKDISLKRNYQGPPHNNFILLHCCSKSKSHKCQTIDLEDSLTGFRPAELKYQSHVNQWHRIESQLSLQTVCYFSNQKKEKLDKVIEEGLRTLFESLDVAVVMLRGRVVRDEGEPLIKQKKTQQISPETIQAGFLMRKPPEVPKPPLTITHARSLSLEGGMVLLAYVHPKATSGEAIAAIREDAQCSIMSRVHALMEAEDAQQCVSSDQLLEPAAQQDLLSDQLPLRVALDIHSIGLQLTEYRFPDEEPQECCVRASDLTGVPASDITSQAMEQFSEHNAILCTSAGEQPPTNKETREATANFDNSSELKSYFGILSVIATITAVILAISVWMAMQ